MKDLDVAKAQLHKKRLTLTIVKKGNILFETASHGISGFLHAIKQLGSGLQGASVADRVVGKANALLFVYAGISEVYAEILSKKANAVFRENRIPFEWKELAINILNSNRSSICPFEKAVADVSDPKRAYAELKALLKSFNT